MTVLFSERMHEAFDGLFQDMTDPMMIINEQNEIVKWNETAKETFFPILDRAITSFLPPNQLQEWNQFLERLKLQLSATSKLLIPFPQCTPISFLIEGYYSRSMKEYIIRFKRTPKKEDTMGIFPSKMIQKYAPYSIVVCDSRGRIVDMNYHAEQLFCLSKEMMIGKPSYWLFNWFQDSKTSLIDYYKQIRKTGHGEITRLDFYQNGDKKCLQLLTNYDVETKKFVTIILDETEKYRLKKQIDHQVSLSSLGKLAASIAHEIRNPMTSLKGFTQLLATSVDEEGNQFLKVINHEIDRMESILNEFLFLSKPSTSTFKTISVFDILTQVIDFMNPQSLLQNTQLSFTALSVSEKDILGDAGELKKVFMNMIKNALEVLEDGGYVDVTYDVKGDHILIEIRDDGSGMTKEQLENLFTPFYTTKSIGTGLGLAHAFETIQNHKGTIDVESEVGHGTAFFISLPIVRNLTDSNSVKIATSLV